MQDKYDSLLETTKKVVQNMISQNQMYLNFYKEKFILSTENQNSLISFIILDGELFTENYNLTKEIVINLIQDFLNNELSNNWKSIITFIILTNLQLFLNLEILDVKKIEKDYIKIIDLLDDWQQNNYAIKNILDIK